MSAGRGLPPQQALSASRLGRKFLVRDGEPEFARRLAVAYRDHNAEAGEHWNATITADVRAQIRTRVAVNLFSEEYGRPPADDRELSGFIARNTRARTTAVAGYDLTFSPVKSVSALWAIAPLPVAEQIEAAHDAAVADVLEWLQDSAAFTRTGANGVAQVDTEGLIAAAFTHRDSRAGDPDLHTHVAVSNKVSHVDANGVRRWLALDGQPLHRVTVAASELYNTRLEAHMIASLGVRFVEQARGRGKRPVREIDGMSTELMSRWSSRRAAIEARTAELAKQFQAAHGREPTNVEIIALAQQATLESREAKHEPRSLAEQRHTWRTQAVEVLGRPGLQSDAGRHPRRSRPHPKRTRGRCGLGRGACWRTDRHRQRGALNLAAPPRARRGAAPGPRARPGARWRTGRTPHRHRTGASVFGAARPRRRYRVWVSPSHCVAATAPASTAATASRSTPARRRWPPSGASCPPSVAKTVDGPPLAMSNWRWRIRRPEAARSTPARPRWSRRWRPADAVSRSRWPRPEPARPPRWPHLRTPGAARADTSSAWPRPPTRRSCSARTSARPPTPSTSTCGQPTPPRPRRSARPNWFDKVGPDTLIVVDEAGKAATAGLDAMITDALRKGASVRLVGDDGQLSSISAGGVLRDIAEATDALTLSEVVRFRSPAEAAAGLALHDADPAGIGFYIDNHRIHVGTDDTAADMAYHAWRADLAAGADSILLAPTNDVINALNARARTDRLAADPDAAERAHRGAGRPADTPASGTPSAPERTRAGSRSGATTSSATATATPSPKS